MFKSGDTVKTIDYERDIELIPSGTVIKLTRPNGEHLWYGNGKIYGVERTLLVKTSNIELVKSASS